MSQPAPDTPQPENRPPTAPTLDEPTTPLTPDTRLSHTTLAPEAVGATNVPSSGVGSRYRTTRMLGRGGLGEVFVAIDEELKREVALKEIQARHLGRSENRRRFVLEAEVTGRLEHPGIVPIYGLGAYADGRPYYAMRFIRGDSFEQAITQFHAGDQTGRDPGERTLAFRALLRRFNDVCNAIAYAHDKGVLHRDLKPANVMLGTFGETLVVDWGLAKVLHAAEETPNRADMASAEEPASDSMSLPQTLQGSVVGTPAYMSPEQAAGATLGPATDVYSLGAILYHLLTGQPPLVGGGVLALLERVQRGDFPPPRRIKATTPAALEAICLKALALRPEERYPSAKDLAADVDHWLADEPVAAYREPLSARVRRWGRRHRALVSSLAALVLTLVAALAVGLGLVNAEKNRTAAARDDERRANVGLTAALARETKLKENLEVALKSAAEQRKLALETMKDVANVFDARLKNNPGLQDLRKELLDRATKGLRKVARAVDTAGQIDQQTVWVHFELGDIFLNIDGAASEAKAQYECAQELAQRLASEPANAECQRDLALSHSKMGDVQLAQGASQAALASYRKSLTIREKLAALEPSNPDWQRDLSISHNRIGDVQHQQGASQAALASYQESLKICQKLSAAHPDNTTVQRDLAIAYFNIGDEQLEQGDSKAALASYRDAQQLSQRLADADPKNATAQRDLAVSYTKMGDVQRQQGDSPAALASYQECLKLSQQRVAADPSNAAAQRDLSICHNNIGDVQRQQGHSQEALAAYQEALKIRQKLAAADPSNAGRWRDLSVSHNNVGEVQQKQGDSRAALASYQESLKVSQKLASADPSNAEAQRDISVTQDHIGDLQFQQGDTKAALTSYEASLKISQQLAAANPKNGNAQRDLAISYNKIGNVQRQQGDTKAAFASFQEYLKIAQQLTAADPRNAADRRTLAVAHLKMGDVQRQQLDRKAALTSYQEGLKISQRLAAADASNATTQRDLSVFHDRIGDMQMEQGDGQTALASYHEGLKIRQKLAAVDPSNAEAQHDLLVTYFNLGNIAEMTSELTQAVDLYQQSLAVAKHFPRPAAFANEARILEMRLRVCRGARLVLDDPAALQQVAAAERNAVLNAVVRAHVRGKAAEKASAAADWLVENAQSPLDIFAAARGYANCVALADKAETKERYAARAVVLLRQAVAKGYKDVAILKKNVDLEVLRDREDFKVLLKEMEVKPNKTP